MVLTLPRSVLTYSSKAEPLVCQSQGTTGKRQQLGSSSIKRKRGKPRLSGLSAVVSRTFLY